MQTSHTTLFFVFVFVFYFCFFFIMGTENPFDLATGQPLELAGDVLMAAMSSAPLTVGELQYADDPRGNPAIRGGIAAWVASRRALGGCTPQDQNAHQSSSEGDTLAERMCFTDGTSGALGMLLRIHAPVGSAVVVEDPTYFLALGIIADHLGKDGTY
jgi:aspartate/methionine/tyrosine aminotransferase